MEEEDYSIPKKIIEKSGFIMERIDKNKYILNFSIKNDKIILKKIITFEIMKILYEINKDIFEDFTYTKINGTSVEAYFLFKHFFSEFGLPQKYTHLNIEMIDDIDNNVILFACQNSTTNSLIIQNKGEQMKLDSMFLKFKLINDHNVEITNNIFFANTAIIPAFAEKMAGIITCKMFIKIKQFIESAIV